jgi:hypothetical protein
MPTGEDPFRVLQRHGVDFVIVGGHAVIYHGFIRATEDYDAVWRRSPENDAALFQALTEMDAKYIGNDIDLATGIERTYPVTASYLEVRHLLMLWTRFGFLDLFDYVPGHPRADVGELFSTSVEFEGLRYVSRDWLAATKRAAGRSQDVKDLRGLGLD